MQTVKDALREIRRYPSAIAGLLIVLMLVVLSIYVVIAIPYREAITLWRGGEGTWRSLPRTVPPAWINTFRSQKLPETIDLDSRKGAAERQETPLGEGKSVTLLYTFDYQADDFPREINIFFETSYKERAPFASITWYTPDGREIAIADLALQAGSTSYRFAQDDKLLRRIRRQVGDVPPEVGLFVAPNPPENPRPL